MQIFPENYTVAYTVPLVDLNGQPVVPNEVWVTIANDREELLHGFTAPFEQGATAVSFDVAGEHNVLGDAANGVEGRFVTVTFKLDAGDITQRLVYVIQGLSPLVAPENSFQSFEQAQLTAFLMPHVEDFKSATVQQQQIALMEAFLRITRISLKFVNELEEDAILPRTRRHAIWTYLAQTDWTLVTTEVFATWPEKFVTALRKAQVAEANAILVNDPIGAKRRAGILSESIGESSMMFRNGFIDLGVSDKTLEYLTGLVHYDFRVTR